MTGSVATPGRSAFECGSTPFLAIRARQLDANIDEMAAFCRRNDVLLAPHVKTHMSVELWERQRAAGAVAATVATVDQAAVLVEAGAERVLIANQVVHSRDLARLADLRRSSPSSDIAVLVDSAESAARLSSVVEGASARPLPVLIEVGAARQRSGVRSVDDARRLALALRELTGVRLVGVEGYEGLFAEADLPDRLELVHDYLDLAGDVVEVLIAEGLLPEPAVASFGGSAFYPTVVERIRGRFPRASVRVVLRSGCYVTHDDGMYASMHLAVPSRIDKPALTPAMEVWAPVLSVPEPGLAVVGAGRRSMGTDAGLPVPLRRRRETVGALAGASAVRVNDQHTMVEFGADDLRVGDLVAFGVSHPCTTFDRWRRALIVDEDYVVVEVIHPRFG